MTTGRPTGAHWRTAATIVATAAIIISAIGFSTTAQATEFDPKPTGSVTETCDGGPAFQVHLGNVDGHGPADFGITITDDSEKGGIPDHYGPQLVAGDSTDLSFPQTEDHEVHILVYSGETVLAEVTHTFDCKAPLSGTITLDCTHFATVWFEVLNTDTVDHDITLVYPDGQVGNFPGIDPGLQVGMGAFVDEGDHVTGQITDDGAVIATIDTTVDCQDPTATIALDCSSGDPVLDYTMTENRPTETTFVASLDGVDDAVQHIGTYYGDQYGTVTESKPLVEGAPFDAKVTADALGITLAELSGVADCPAPPTTEPPTTEPPTTEPPTTAPPTTEPPTTVATDPSTTAPPAAVSAVTAEPSFTG